MTDTIVVRDAGNTVENIVYATAIVFTDFRRSPQAVCNGT